MRVQGNNAKDTVDGAEAPVNADATQTSANTAPLKPETITPQPKTAKEMLAEDEALAKKLDQEEKDMEAAIIVAAIADIEEAQAPKVIQQKPANTPTSTPPQQRHDVPTPPQMAESPEEAELFAYGAALSRLSELKNPAHPEYHDQLDAIIAHVEQMKTQGESISDLTTILNDTSDRLLGNMAPARYEERAKNWQGHPNTGWKILGGLMMALAITIATLAIVFATPIVAAVGATLAVSAVAAEAITVAAAGVSTGVPVALGFGFFHKGQQKGLSETALQLNELAPTQAPVETPRCKA